MIGTFASLLLTISVSEAGLRAVVDEMANAQLSCGLAGVNYVQAFEPLGRGYVPQRTIYVLIARAVYARREEPQIAAGINCSAQVVAARGYKPIVSGTKK